MSLELQASSDSLWQLRGELTLATMPTLLDSAPVFSAMQVQLDLSEVTRIDSASIAGLFWLSRRASDAGGNVVFTQIPEQIQAMARLYGVEEFIND